MSETTPGKFKDLFSGHSTDYSKFRPAYPPALFDHLAGAAPARRRAWDCGTGNGQAAVELGDRFEEVIATDPSESQLAAARPHPRVRYERAPADASGIDAGSVDLITVAQALHWFPLERFFAECRRVARPGGAVLAVWCYELAEISPEIDRAVLRYYREGIGKFWEPERKLVESGYRAIEIPFTEELEVPPFEMRSEWILAQLTGYLGTWSATRKAMSETGRNPLEEYLPELEAAWGDPQAPRTIRWPLSVRAGWIR